MVQLIRWLLTKHGFTEDHADAIIDKLRSEMTGVTGEKVNDDEARTALVQRLTLFITRLQLDDGTPHHIFEDRYQHNYQIILQIISQIFVGIPVGVISGILGNKLYAVIMVNNENRQHAEFCWKIGNIYLQQGALDRAIDEYGQAIRFYPGYAQAFHDRGLAHLRKRRERSRHRGFR
jgi:hypothetical protein